MQYMVTDIIQSIDLKKDDAFYIGRERVIMVQNTPIKICLKKQALDDIRAEKEVSKEDATLWI